MSLAILPLKITTFINVIIFFQFSTVESIRFMRNVQGMTCATCFVMSRKVVHHLVEGRHATLDVSVKKVTSFWMWNQHLVSINLNVDRRTALFCMYF